MKKMFMFTAPWCRVCVQYEPVVKGICVKYGVEFQKIDIEQEPKIAEQYRVTSLPKLVLLGDDGWPIKTHPEVLSREDLEEWFR